MSTVCSGKCRVNADEAQNIRLGGNDEDEEEGSAAESP